MPTLPLPPIAPEYRRFVLEYAPAFARRVRAAARAGGDARATLLAFRDNPFLLYAALWYADSEGVAVTVTPTGKVTMTPTGKGTP